MSIKIVTNHVFPPIPMRAFDWCAHYDDEEGLVGWGPTEQAAIAELRERTEERDNREVRYDGGCLYCAADAGEACHPNCTRKSR